MLLEIAAGLFIVSWVLGALMKVGGFLTDLGPLEPYPPSRPGEWKEGLRNMVIIIGAGLALYWFVP